MSLESFLFSLFNLIKNNFFFEEEEECTLYIQRIADECWEEEDDSMVLYKFSILVF